MAEKVLRIEVFVWLLGEKRWISQGMIKEIGILFWFVYSTVFCGKIKRIRELIEWVKFELLVLLQTNSEISSGIKIGINHENFSFKFYSTW